MKTIKKVGFIAIILAFVMLMFSLFNGTPVAREVKVRTLDTGSIASLSYDERAQQELEQFDEYEVYEQQNGDIIKFVGTRSYSAGEFTDCDYVDLNYEDVNVTYDLSCDTNTSEVTVEVTYEQNDEVVNVDYVNISKIEYQEDEECAIIYFEDGTIVNSHDYLSEETLDNCVAIAAAAAGTVTVLLQVVVVVLVAVIVYYVLSWLFPWLERAVTSYRYERRTAYKQQTYAVPAITINGVRYEAKPKTKAEVKALPRKKSGSDPAVYYLAFASGISNKKDVKDTVLTEGGLYIANKITYAEAIEVMTTSEVAKVTRDGVTYSFIPSIYSYYETDVLAVMDDIRVGYHEDTPRMYPEWHIIGEGTVNGLPHYHPQKKYDLQIEKEKGTKIYRHHAFFTVFNLSTWNTYKYA